MPKIGDREVNNNDFAVLAAGTLLFVFSFFHWFGNHVCVTSLGHKSCGNIPGYGGESGWHAGFLAWFGIVLCLLAAVRVAVRVFSSATMPTLPVSDTFLVLALSVVGAFFIVLKLLIGEHASAFGVSASLGRAFGIYIGTILAIVEAVFAYFTFQASGEKLPWAKGA